MKLIRADKVSGLYNPVKIGSRLLLVSEKFQIGCIKGQIKVRPLSKAKNYDSLNEGYYFHNLKDAVKFACKL